MKSPIYINLLTNIAAVFFLFMQPFLGEIVSQQTSRYLNSLPLSGLYVSCVVQ